MTALDFKAEVKRAEKALKQKLRKVSTAKIKAKRWSLFLPGIGDNNLVALQVTVELEDGCEKTVNIAI